MDKENKKPKFDYRTNNILKKINDPNNPFKILSKFIGTITDQLHEQGQKVEASTKKNLKIYFENILRKTIEIKDEAMMYQFLLNEKRFFENKIITADIEKNISNKKYYQKHIEIIIDPLIEQYNRTLELRKKLPELTDKPIINDLCAENSQTLPVKKATDSQQEESKKENQGTSKSDIRIIPELPEGFNQIKNLATKKEILYFFLILSEEKNEVNDKPYMKREDVISLCEKNFSYFNCKPIGKYFKINLTNNQKNRLRYFIYQFFAKYEERQHNNKEIYARLIVDNFENYRYDNVSSLKKNMCETHKPKNNCHIKIEKYFNI